MANGYIPAAVERGCDPCSQVKVENKAFLGGVLGIDVNGERQPISEAGIVDLTFIEEETREAAEQAIASAQAAAESEQTASEAAASARSSESAAQTAANAAEAAKADAEDAARSANSSKNTAESHASAAQSAAASAQVADGNAERSAESAIAAAAQAASSAGAAQQYANEAYSSASTAQTASGAAEQSATAASTSAQAAATLVEVATQAAADAESFATDAEAAQTTAAQSATAASGSATAAAGSATQAAASATAADASATAAAQSAATLTLDATLTSATQAAQAKAVGDEISTLFNTVMDKHDIAWYTSSNRPTGWRKGYGYGQNGKYVTNDLSNYYIRSHFAINANNYNLLYAAQFLEITPPTGYVVRIFETDDDANIINQWGYIDPSSHPELTGKPLLVPFNPNRKYYPSVGRFGNEDSGTYAVNAEFIASIKLACYTLKQDHPKLPRETGGYAFFTVDVDRPLPFGGEEVTTSTDTVDCVLRLPSTYTPTGKPTRLVLACHGASGYISPPSTWYNSNWTAFIDALLAAGYACFDANVLPSSYGTSVKGAANGSPLYVNVLKKAYDYIVENYNVYPQVFAHGTSMGGTGASAFVNAYPELVLAQSSFAGRDFTQYLQSVHDESLADLTTFALAYGYEDFAALTADKFSHAVGVAPCLSLLKYSNGSVVLPPDRDTDYQNWLAYYGEIQTHARTDAIGDYSAHRSVPYKSWNSWADDAEKTKAEMILQKAYTTGNSAPYLCVVYESGTHTELSYGQINDMRNQLIAWFKRWE